MAVVSRAPARRQRVRTVNAPARWTLPSTAAEELIDRASVPARVRAAAAFLARSASTRPAGREIGAGTARSSQAGDDGPPAPLDPTAALLVRLQMIESVLGRLDRGRMDAEARSIVSPTETRPTRCGC